MMQTETLARNLRRAIEAGDTYHIALYGEEACRRLVKQKDALDALQTRRDAAGGADAPERGTEPAPGRSGPQAAFEGDLDALRLRLQYLQKDMEFVQDAIADAAQDAEWVLADIRRTLEGAR